MQPGLASQVKIPNSLLPILFYQHQVLSPAISKLINRHFFKKNLKYIHL